MNKDVCPGCNGTRIHVIRKHEGITVSELCQECLGKGYVETGSAEPSFSESVKLSESAASKTVHSRLTD